MKEIGILIRNVALAVMLGAIVAYFITASINRSPFPHSNFALAAPLNSRKYDLRESYYIAGNAHEDSAVYNSEASCEKEKDLFLKADVGLPEGNREAYCIPEPKEEESK